MSGSTFTNDNNLELQPSGQRDWDTSNNANYAILERGYHVKLAAATTIASGQVCTIGSGSIVWPMNANSMSNKPHLISYKSVTSGTQTQFISRGVVRSMGVWSGNINPGEPVFVSVSSPGFCVKSFAGCGKSVGIALAVNAVLFAPGHHEVFPDIVSYVNTIGPITVGSYGVFAAPMGWKGTIRDVIIQSSHDRMKLRFWSGSSNVSSELLYETLTRSWSPGSADITSVYYRDRALFPVENTDANSAWYLYGRVDAQSGTSVTSAYVAVTIIGERIR